MTTRTTRMETAPASKTYLQYSNACCHGLSILKQNKSLRYYHVSAITSNDQQSLLIALEVTLTLRPSPQANGAYESKSFARTPDTIWGYTSPYLLKRLTLGSWPPQG